MWLVGVGLWGFEECGYVFFLLFNVWGVFFGDLVSGRVELGIVNVYFMWI